MRSKLATAVLCGLAYAVLGLVSVGRAADPPKAKVTFQDHVSQVFRSRCGSCHNPDKQKGGLNLDNLRRDDAGRRLGQGRRAGRPRQQQAPAGRHAPGRAQDAAGLGQDPRRRDRDHPQVDRGGRLENTGSVASAKAKPKFEFKLDPASLGKPSGTPAMPEGVTTEPFVPQAKPGAVVAMASSPWAPLVAIAGHKQVLLYRTTDNHLVGVLPFPEGLIYVLKFSRNGDLLLAGGGRGRPVRRGRRLGRQEGHPRLRGRQGIRHRARRRHQPRPQPGRPRRARQGRTRL